ncbi:MAG: hypothetical protein ACRCUI_11685, partial [Polymorphobacter sp.]
IKGRKSGAGRDGAQQGGGDMIAGGTHHATSRDAELPAESAAPGCAAAMKASTLARVAGRGSRPRRRSKTKRGSPATSRPNREGGTAARRRWRSTVNSKFIVLAPLCCQMSDSAGLTIHPDLNPTSLGKKL